MRILEIVGDISFGEIITPQELAWLEGQINDLKFTIGNDFRICLQGSMMYLNQL